MPTIVHLVAAIFYAALGYLLAMVAVRTLPVDANVGMFREVIAAIGAVSGWLIVGPRAGRPAPTVLGLGVTTAVSIYFWGLVFVSGYQMLVKSMSFFYSDPLHALEGMLGLALERGAIVTNPGFVILLIGGGLIGALVCFTVQRIQR